MTYTNFDALTTNAIDLQKLLAEKKTTSVQIVTQYLKQIDLHEKALNAFISVAPRDFLLRIAASLDEERLQGHCRSPLHGVPIVLKDVFITDSDLGMGTTAGSAALVGAKASKNSAIVQRLVDAGLIIMGKTNMTEFAGMKTSSMTPGWSAVGGQTLSPYVGAIEDGETLLGHSGPGGSSTGSAVAVAAGLSPLAMGTETIGSLITPGSRAALYVMKPTVGVQDASGLYTMTEFFDSPGPMAKCAADLRLMTEVLLGRTYNFDGLSWGGLSVGFLDPQKEDYESAIAKIKERGCSVKYPVEIADLSALTVDGQDAIMPIALWEFKNIGLPRFLASFDECSVGNLDELVNYYEENKEKCLPPPFPDQSDLIKALSNDDTEDNIASLRVKLRNAGKTIIDHALDEAGVDVIAAPADSPLCIHAAAAGYPIATVPLGQLRYNRRPFGLCLLARAGGEETLLQFMSVYESLVSGPRAVPVLKIK